MSNFYEVVLRDGRKFPKIIAFDTLDEAVEFSEVNGIKRIDHNGGGYETYEKCPSCGKWFDSVGLNANGYCESCEMCAKEHGF